MKDRLNEALKTYFILVTLITILMFVLGTLFDGDRTLGYDAYLSPLIYAVIGTLPNLLLGSDKELSVKGLLIRRFFELIFIEAAVLMIAFSVSTIPTEHIEVVIGLAIGIVVVYILTLVVEYIFELANSKKLNEELYKYQKMEPPNNC